VKSTNLKENAGKVKSDFVIRAALRVEKFGVEKYAQKTCGCGQSGGH